MFKFADRVKGRKSGPEKIVKIMIMLRIKYHMWKTLPDDGITMSLFFKSVIDFLSPSFCKTDVVSSSRKPKQIEIKIASKS